MALADPEVVAEGSARRRELLLWLAFAGVAALRLWLVRDQPLTAYGPAHLDDRLMLEWARAILDGQWLGPYDYRTLIKGPIYSLWLALAWRFDLPVLMGHQLLRVAACALALLAFRPLLPSALARAALGGVLLFEPVAYSAELARVARMGIYPALSLGVIAAAVGLLTRLAAPIPRLASWSLALALLWPLFWLTREEGAFLLPGLAIVLGVSLWRLRSATERGVRLALVCLPLVGWAAGVGTVASLNARYYGVFEVGELRGGAFVDAYGALTRVERDRAPPFVPVPRATRRAIYGVSPAFLELEPHLEGRIGRFYSKFGTALQGSSASGADLAGGWFIWALRHSAANSGHYKTASDASSYWARLAREVNTACAEGRLECGRSRSSLAPALRIADLPTAARAVLEVSIGCLMVPGAGLEPRPSVGTPEWFPLFEQLTRSRLVPVAGAVEGEPFPPPLLSGIASTLCAAFPLVSGLAALGLGFALVDSLRARRASDALVVAVAIALSTLVRIVILAWIHATSFPALALLYLAPLYPILWLHHASVGVFLVARWRGGVRA